MTIKQLDKRVINRIAAGEVVVDPAAALKELVENALDAGASNIEVRIDGAGLKRIEVVDDGCGVHFEQLPLAITRHATSKISHESDLQKIHTLGFRGEALPSIASVSRFLLESKTTDGPGGVVEVDAGKTIRHEQAGVPSGTRVVVEDLFYAVPARLKFLKSPAYEQKKMQRILRGFCLSRPDVDFKYVQDDKQKFFFARRESVEQRLFDVLGHPWTGKTEQVWEERDESELKVFFTRPEVSFSNSLQQYFFLNGRLIQDRGMGHAIHGAYRTLLMERRFPGVVLFLRMPPSEFDVNVHPAKHEVRFKDKRLIQSWIGGLIRGHLLTYKIPTGAPAPIEPRYESEAGIVKEASFQFSGNLLNVAAYNPSPREMNRPVERIKAGYYSSMRFIGQLRSSYILLEGSDGLVVIDQHAAHERILFEKIRKELRCGDSLSQRLLEPVVVNISDDLQSVLQKFGKHLQDAGFEIEAFGGQDVLVRALPDFVQGDVTTFLLELFEDLRSSTADSVLDDAIDLVAEKLACKAAIKFNHRLDSIKVRQLLSDLDETPGATNCPHGRPIYFSLTENDLIRVFKRKV